MDEARKKRQLNNHKFFATGLFILMLVVFFLSIWLQKTNPASWVGYLKAFSEAAMVGALADWFAVTAIFNHPLELKIPHTNLIEKSKDRIGDNLGDFVVNNFLSAENIRPYIEKLHVSNFLGNWLSLEKNQTILLNEISSFTLNIINDLDDNAVIEFIHTKAKDIAEDIKINQIIGNGIEYLVKGNAHEKIVTQLAFQIKKYILENENIVRERVKKESFALIPSFVDNKIAAKITKSISTFFSEIEENKQHPLRQDITRKLEILAEDIQTNPEWETELNPIREALLSDEKLKTYSKDIWFSAKENMMAELAGQESRLKNYLKKNIDQFAVNLNKDEPFRDKIDFWVQKNAYQLILKNRKRVSELISTTIGKWEGKELSEKLQLEVGKDLQFIRINGTLVGGIVGLFIHFIQKIVF